MSGTEHDILSRLSNLESRNAIVDLQARYAAFADAKYRPTGGRAPDADLRAAARGQAACFTDDAEWEAGDAFGGTLAGRDALETFFAAPPWRFALHYYVAPEITLDGDAAVARWRLWQVGVREPAGDTVILAGVAVQSLRRTEGSGWRIARMRFEQTHIFPLGPGEALARQNDLMQDV